MIRCLLLLARIVSAALWALPGPIAVGVCLAISLGPFDYNHVTEFDSLSRVAVDNLYACKEWFVVQILMAIAYGVFRAIVGPANLKCGILNGVVVWAGLAVLIAGFSCSGQRPLYFSSVVFPGDRHRHAEEFLFVVRFMSHIVGGAIAGFHVEHYLLREAKRNREVTQR